jgi:hypothetical protein
MPASSTAVRRITRAFELPPPDGAAEAALMLGAGAGTGSRRSGTRERGVLEPPGLVCARRLAATSRERTIGVNEELAIARGSSVG